MARRIRPSWSSLHRQTVSFCPHIYPWAEDRQNSVLASMSKGTTDGPVANLTGSCQSCFFCSELAKSTHRFENLLLFRTEHFHYTGPRINQSQTVLLINCEV